MANNRNAKLRRMIREGKLPLTPSQQRERDRKIDLAQRKLMHSNSPDAYITYDLAVNKIHDEFK